MMAIEPEFNTSKEAKEAGWFSRRHKTSKEHLESKKKREEIMRARKKELGFK